MKNIDRLASRKYSLSLVVTKDTSFHSGNDYFVGVLIPTHLAGGRGDSYRWFNSVKNDWLEKLTPDGSDLWYPLAVGATTVDAINNLEKHIDNVITKVYPQSLDRYAACVWNTAVAMTTHQQQVQNMSRLLVMDDLSRLIL